MANSLVSIQIIPKTPNGENSIPYVDRAIEIIKASGVAYQVNPLETTMEGDMNELLGVIAQMNEAMIEMDCVSVISQIKICYKPSGITMNELTEKHRP
ncbi:thiamine-binding protein [Paenibacillus marinisediminis]